MAKVCINPGHGAQGDYGACANGQREADNVLKIALAVRDKLQQSGVEVIMTRTTTDGPVLSECVKMGNNANVDYYLSIHENAGGGTGTEAWVHKTAPDKSRKAAEKLVKAVTDATGLKSRGVKDNQVFAVCRDTKMSACLLEVCFIDNKEDLKAVETHFDALAGNLARALCEIVGVDYKVGQSTPAAPHTKPANPFRKPTQNIYLGDWGDGVKWVQWELRRHGYDIGRYGIDGKYGASTQTAVRAFQRAHNLAVDGIVGVKTRAALEGA